MPKTAGKTDATPFVDWLARDQHFTEGIDHLGIQVVSTNLYAQLLPGISNLTDRARYFSFYPWVLDSFARISLHKGQNDWRRWIRRHEFTFSAASIAAENEGKIADEASGGVIGARASRRILNKKGSKSVDIDEATRLDDKGKAAKGTYFKNREGGYGQYYKNQMTVLGLMRRDEERKAPDRQLTKYAGAAIAGVVEKAKAFRELRDIAAHGSKVSLKELISLGEQIHPGSMDPDDNEATHLRKIVLGEDDGLCKGQTPESRSRRRHTLALALDYLQKHDTDWETPVAGFRWGVLEESFGDGKQWSVPGSLESTRLGWAAYVQNELLNYSLECLMWSVVNMIEDGPRAPREHAQIVAEAVCSDKHVAKKLPARVDVAVAAYAPPKTKDPWGDHSTWSLFEALQQTEKPLPCAAAAIRLLFRVAADRARYGGNHPFASIPRGDEIAARDIHLQSWWDRVDAAPAEATESFLVQLILDWVIYRHLRVATHKLASQGDYTYRFRPEEGMLVGCGEVQPTFTSPRLRQGMRMLADIGLISQSFDKLTKHGRALLAVFA